MTIGGERQALGMREMRERIRAVVARVADGQPLVILQHGVPAAVLIGFGEAERWGRIERGLAVLHALRIYPELLAGSVRLADAIAGQLRPSRSAIAQLEAEPRELAGPLVTVQITALREQLASHLAAVATGQALTVVSSGRFAAVLISPREFDRLRRLHEIVAGCAGLGLDLAGADEAAIAAFVADRRAERDARAAVG